MLAEIAVWMLYFTTRCWCSGELTDFFMAYHAFRGEMQRNKVIIPEAHGIILLQPLWLLVGVQISSRRWPRGFGCFKSSSRLAALMLTNPNTLGLFETEIEEIMGVHAAGGLLYYDGANISYYGLFA